MNYESKILFKNTSLHFTSLRLVFLLLFFLTACEREQIPQINEEVVSEEALLLELDGNHADGSAQEYSCSCEYKILNVVIDNQPTNSPGDHPEFYFHAEKNCNPLAASPYFGALIGECNTTGYGPETDFYPNGTTSTPYAPFRCNLPLWDQFDLDLNPLRWLYNGCVEYDDYLLSGEITYQVRCREFEGSGGEPLSCREGGVFESNVMTSEFENVNMFGDAKFINSPIVKLGWLELIVNGDPVMTEGCGCEPYISEGL